MTILNLFPSLPDEDRQRFGVNVAISFIGCRKIKPPKVEELGFHVNDYPEDFIDHIKMLYDRYVKRHRLCEPQPVKLKRKRVSAIKVNVNG